MPWMVPRSVGNALTVLDDEPDRNDGIILLVSGAWF